MELYKKYRPFKFEQVVGHSAAVDMLRGMLESGSLPQTILLHGPSGCGKTTFARILMSGLDCHDLDTHEMNSSSYRGIDTVRELAVAVMYQPLNRSKVYIMDEVHKLTNDAQNALLKLLEDTPKNVYFVLCTTDPNKLLAALRNRCCAVALPRLTNNELRELLDMVASAEDVDIDGYVDEIVLRAQGSARALLVLLDQLAHTSKNEWDELLDAERADKKEAIDLCRVLFNRKARWPDIAKMLTTLESDPESVRWAVLGYARAVLLKSGTALAYHIITAFSEPFYDTKAAGLAAACYEAKFGAQD